MSEIRSRRRRRGRFGCLDCGVDIKVTEENFMVLDAVWLSAHPDDFGNLCVGCLEARLGRRLTPRDFSWCPLNVGAALGDGSARLRDRLGVHDVLDMLGVPRDHPMRRGLPPSPYEALDPEPVQPGLQFE